MGGGVGFRCVGYDKICFLLLILLSFLLAVDRVFRADCSTRQVYEEAAKEVALSVVSGINCEFLSFFSAFLPSSASPFMELLC